MEFRDRTVKDKSFEFVKGVAITSVILLHTIDMKSLSSMGHIYHIGQTVPIFFLTTFILSFKSLDNHANNIFSYWFSMERLLTIVKKIIAPFFITQLLLWFTMLLLSESKEMVFAIRGYGPGAYYFWIYLQFWFLIPFLYSFLNRYSLVLGGAVFLMINVILQLICSIVDSLGDNYQYLFFRYFYLSFLGFLFIRLELNRLSIMVFALVGISYLYSLSIINYEPFFYNSWMSQQMPAFFYTYVLLTLLLRLYKFIGDCKMGQFFVSLGGWSWFVFLVQLYVVRITLDCFFDTLGGSSTLSIILYPLVVYIICVCPFLLYDKMARNCFIG